MSSCRKLVIPDKIDLELSKGSISHINLVCELDSGNCSYSHTTWSMRQPSGSAGGHWTRWSQDDVDKWTHLSSSSPFAQAEAAEDHYLPQHIHHTMTWPNGKHQIMTSIDPFTDSCSPPAHSHSSPPFCSLLPPSIALEKKKKPSRRPIFCQPGRSSCHSLNVIVDT